MTATVPKENAQTVDALLVANFASTDGSRNCRFNDVARRLRDLGADVELVTSDFEHDDHTFRKNPVEPNGYKLTLVHETGYSKNISIRRLASQYAFARHLKRYLKARPAVPDLMYCAMPSPDAARVCAQYAKQHDIPFVVDIQDLWPEAFGMRFRASKLIRVLFYGMVKASRVAYEQAELVVGVSQTYITAAEKTVRKTLRSSVVFLGSSLGVSEAPDTTVGGTKSVNTIRIAYAGTLSHSYDLPMVIDALASLRKLGGKFAELELIVLGDGPLRQEFEDYASKMNLPVQFLGKVPYPQMMEELRNSHIAVNPIVAGSAGSVLNKVGDYAAAALPVVNSQESPEYRSMVDRYNAGINCRVGDSWEVAAAIRELVEEPEKRLLMGTNNRRMAEELFDRNKTYAELAQQVMSLAAKDVPQGSRAR